MSELITFQKIQVQDERTLYNISLREILEEANSQVTSKDYFISEDNKRGFILENSDLWLGYAMYRNKEEQAQLSFFNLPEKMKLKLGEIPAVIEFLKPSN